MTTPAVTNGNRYSRAPDEAEANPGIEPAVDVHLPIEAIEKSAVVPQVIIAQQQGWDSLGENLLLAAGKVNDIIQPWGTAPFLRDRQLRSFITTDPFGMSAIATVIARNVGLSWMLDGPSLSVEKCQDVLHSAQFGQGWEVYNTKLGWDYQTQDRASVTELVREEDDPRAPVIGLNQLDVGRCWHTGNPMFPILYQDRVGRWHAMKWYQCLTLSEMPTAHETLYGMQYSSLTRMLVIARTMANILKIDEERSGGRWTQSVNIVSGIKKGEIENAMNTNQQMLDQLGLVRMARPAVLTTVDPNAKPTLLEISLARKPEEFKVDDSFKWYMTLYAMALFVDYGELAPLPGNNMGTSAQSVMMHRKSRSKGIALWTNKIEHQFNFFGVVPKNVTFKYDDKDLEEDQARSDVFLGYAQAFQALATASKDQVLDGQAIREMLLDIGLIPQDIYDEIMLRVDTLKAPDPMELAPLPGGPAVKPTVKPSATVPDNQTTQAARAPGPGKGTTANDSENAAKGLSEKLDEERLIVEDALTKDATRALSEMGSALRRRLGDNSEPQAAKDLNQRRVY